MRVLNAAPSRSWLPPVVLALATCWPCPVEGQAPGATAGAGAAALELVVIGPADTRSSTEREFVNVIGRSSPKAAVRVAGVDAAVFATGIFVRDRVPLEIGANTIRIEAVGPGGETAVRTIEVERQPPPAESRAVDRLVIDVKSVEPRSILRVVSGEPVEVSFRATPEMMAEARLPGGRWQRLDEAADAGTGQPAGLYLGYLVPAATGDTTPRPVQVRLKAAPRAAVQGRRSVTAESAGAVGVWAAERVRLVVVADAGADLTWGLHDVRLGGPNLTELGAGTVLRITGQRGEFYRVRLAPDTEAWVRTGAVRPSPPGTPIPELVFTSLSVSGDASGDTVVIPFTAPVPYAVRSTEEADGRAGLEVEFYGAHNAATWITHRATATVVRNVSLDQPALDRIRVRIALHDRRLWGYKVERVQGSVRVTVRRPPAPSPSPVWPLQGLTIALEPGHGGANNSGARGATGAAEKDINRITVEELQAELERVGARVVVVRPGDENPTLADRSRRVTESGAHLFISMHANAAGTENGYLRVGGTSTYYKHPFCRDLATAIHRRLLQTTGLADFGNVGAFNYTPLRLVTWAPSMLVEQAFMSNPSDEAYLLDPALRAKTIQAVRLGIEDFLSLPRQP